MEVSALYCNHIYAEDCTWFEMARAGVWYTNDITVKNAVIEAPKNFRALSGGASGICDIPECG